MRNYRFDYTVTAYGRSRSAVKKIQAYSWLDAVRRLVEHASRKWVDPPLIAINNAEVDGVLINPDLLEGLDNFGHYPVSPLTNLLGC